MYREKKKTKIIADGKEFAYWRNEILEKERHVLHTLGFDFQLEHPYANMLSKVKQLQHGEDSYISSVETDLICRGSKKACPVFMELYQ